MLSFTTYTIPESAFPSTPEPGAWLWMILTQPPSQADTVLLGKIASALKADTDRDVFTLPLSFDQPLSMAGVVRPETRLIISFGMAPDLMGLWIDAPASGFRMLETFAFIRTLAVPQLATNATAKKELWNAMQTYMELYAPAS